MRFSEAEYADWFTKTEAADKIGVSTKWVEQLARGGQLQQATRGPRRQVVYHPADVARVAAARQPEASAFVLPADAAGNGNGDEPELPALPAFKDVRREILGLRPSVDDQLRTFVAMVRAVTSENTEKSTAPLFVTVSAAAKRLGFKRATVRGLIDAGRLGSVLDGDVVKVRYRDLEEFKP